MSLKEFVEKLKLLYCKLNKVYDIKHINNDLFLNWILKRLHKIEVSQLYELKDENIDKLIKDSITWYFLYGSKATVDDLLDYKDRLLTCSYRLSEILSDKNEKYEVKIIENKDLYSKGVNKFSNDYLPTIAKEKARIGISNGLKVEAQYKGEIKSIERKLNTIDNIASAITQRIAWLRQDYSRSIKHSI